METILSKIEAHEEQNRRLNDELLAEQDATQAKIEQLQAYRLELDSAIRRRGIHPNEDGYVRTEVRDPRIVKRTPKEKVAYVASVPVEMGDDLPLRRLIRNLCSDGTRRSKAEIFEELRKHRPDLKRITVDSMIYTAGLHACKDERPNAHHAAKVYWLPAEQRTN